MGEREGNDQKEAIKHMTVTLVSVTLELDALRRGQACN